MKEFEVFDKGAFLGIFEYDDTFEEDDVRDNLVSCHGYPGTINVVEVVFK